MTLDLLREYEAALVRLQQTIAESGLDAPAADDARAEIERLWPKLGEDERTLVQDLGGDLDMIDGTEIALESANPRDVLARVGKAWDRKDRQSDEVLSLLRFVPDQLPQEKLAYVRARAWSHLGFHRAALCFFDFASARQPGVPAFRVMALNELTVLGDFEELGRRAKTEILRPDTPVLTQLAALRALYWVTMRDPAMAGDNGKADLLRDLAARFEEALRDPSAHARPGHESSVVGSLVVLGFIYQRLGDRARTSDAYGRALAIKPSDESALVARGLLVAASDPAAASADFEAAIALNTRLWWPYAHVALTQLEEGRYADTLSTTQRGLSLPIAETLRANFYELAGLAAYHLNDVAAARQLLEAARVLAPFNERIAANYEIVATESRPDEGDIGLVFSLDMTAEEYQTTLAEEMSLPTAA